MKVLAKTQGSKTEHEISSDIGCIVHQQDIRVDPVDADLIIDSRATIKCMEDMSQEAWEHITGGELFHHLFDMLTKDQPVLIPDTIKEFNEDYDIGVIHGAGLIIMLVESRFEGKKKVFIRTPEDHMHPKMARMLMSVIQEVKKLLGGEDIETDQKEENEESDT